MAAPHAIPSVYARDKLALLRRRWQGIEGDELARYAPRIWPDVPHVALLGLTASSMGLREVVGAADASASALGLWGVERPALRSVLSEERDRLAELLGRPVAQVPRDEAGFLSDPACQTVVGLLNYRRHLGLLRPMVGPLLESDATVWAVQLAAGAYSTGAGTVAGVVMAHRAELERTAAPDRRAVLTELVARDIARGVQSLSRVPLAGHWNGAAFVVRSGQRIACGRLLGENVSDATNRGPEWWGREPSDDTWREVAAVTGSSPASTTSSPAGASSGGGAGLVFGGALAWLGYQLWKAR